MGNLSPTLLSRILVVALVVLGLVALPACRDIRARALVKQGNSLYHEAKYKEAITKYDEAEALNPALHQIYINRGYAYLFIFSPMKSGAENDRAASGAIASFKRYLELFPDDAKVRGYLVSTWIDARRFDEARAFFEQRYQSRPKDMEVVNTLALIASKSGNWPDAMKWYGRRVELDPKNPDTLYSLGVLSWERLYKNAAAASEERIKIADQGLAALERADRMRPNHAETVTYMNLLYRERALGQPDEEKKQADLAKAEALHQRARELAEQARANK